MYASKRRQRNFKRVRESTKPGAPTNPSKRHRERLNGELETVAGLLPFDDVTLQRLDKLSVLRLAVSFLQIKAHFHICGSHLRSQGKCTAHPLAATSTSLPMGPIPSFVDSVTGFPLIDPLEPLFSHVALKALGGFLLILNEQGEIYYVSENIEYYLGFLQSDILHQPIFDMIHSEDREEIRQGLRLHSMINDSTKNTFLNEEDLIERTMIARFRCLLDNTCGFVRVEICGRFTELHSTTQLTQQSPIHRYGLLAVCTPFVPPIQSETLNEDPILKTKHSLDMNLLCADVRFKQIVEIDDVQSKSFYDLVHSNDLQYVADAHSAVIKNTSAGLMIYRLVSKAGHISYVQTSLRVFFKNSKAESIGGTHRVLTEVDGLALLEKRTTMKSKYLTFDDTLLQSPRHLNPQLGPPQPFKELNPKILYEHEIPSTSIPIHHPIPIQTMPDSKLELAPDVNLPKLQQMLPINQELLQHPSSSSIPPTLHAHQNLPAPPAHLFPNPLFPIQLPEHEVNGLGSMFSNYFPAQAMPTDAENLWPHGFKRPLDIYSDPFAAAYYQPAQFEHPPYYLDYNHQPNAWAHEQQVVAANLNGSELQSTSGYNQRLKINDLSQSTALLNAAASRPESELIQPQVEAEQSRYYQLPTTFFPPPNEQPFVEMMPANNFNFLSEVTTLLGNHCQ